MYTSMLVTDNNIDVDRGMALHKMIRLVTIATSGDGYLNFMGNEFGHPEWIDFPREGNNWSFSYARRQWELADNPKLKYHFLNEFDKEMIQLIKEEDTLSFEPSLIVQHTSDQVLIFKRGSLVFVFNFNPAISFTDHGFATDQGKYQILLNTDSEIFGGVNRNDDTIHPVTQSANGVDRLNLYLPSRTAIVLRKND